MYHKQQTKGDVDMEQKQLNYNTEKFQNAEQLWFWFLYSKSVRNGFVHNGLRGTRRACELVDVETLITKLYLSGKLTDEQLQVMKEFGDKRRAPHQYIWRENHATEQWQRAMDVIQKAAQERGWIE